MGITKPNSLLIDADWSDSLDIAVKAANIVHSEEQRFAWLLVAGVRTFEGRISIISGKLSLYEV